MLKEMLLEEFKNKLVEEILKSCDRGNISYDTRKYVTAYKNNNFDDNYIPIIMTKYINYVNNEGSFKYLYFFNKNMDKAINLFLRANICGFFKYRNVPMFSFLAKYKETDNFAFLGILYLKDDTFKIVFPKNEDNEFFRISNLTIDNLLSCHFSKKEFFNSLNDLFSEKKEMLIESFEEFLELVLNLNEENKDLIKPIGEEYLRKLKNVDIK